MIEVGDRVVCVCSRWFPDPSFYGVAPPQVGEVYTVTRMASSDWDPNQIVLELDTILGHGWGSRNFRKVQDPKKGMEILRNLLVPKRFFEPA